MGPAGPSRAPYPPFCPHCCHRIPPPSLACAYTSGKKIGAPWTDEMEQQATSFYVRHYIETFSQPEVCTALAAIPGLNCWDGEWRRERCARYPVPPATCARAWRCAATHAHPPAQPCPVSCPTNSRAQQTTTSLTATVATTQTCRAAPCFRRVLPPGRVVHANRAGPSRLPGTLRCAWAPMSAR